MSNFEEWFLSNGIPLDTDFNVAKRAFEAGQQSQQAKIDELQARIDEITNHVDINFDEGRDDDQHSYWSGYNQAMRELNDILKAVEK